MENTSMAMRSTVLLCALAITVSTLGCLDGVGGWYGAPEEEPSLSLQSPAGGEEL
jgi:hypothetical protein